MITKVHNNSCVDFKMVHTVTFYVLIEAVKFCLNHIIMVQVWACKIERKIFTSFIQQ